MAGIAVALLAATIAVIKPASVEDLYSTRMVALSHSQRNQVTAGGTSVQEAD
jgi:hypothetical protein